MLSNRTFLAQSRILAFCCTIAIAVSVGAQGNPSGDQILAQVQSFYERTRTVEGEFVQSYYYKLYNRTETSKGKVVFAKPGKMRWDYIAHPNGKVIVSDGKLLKIFEPGDPGENGQLIEGPVNHHQLPIAFSFLTGQGNLVREFRAKLLESHSKRFPSGHILELRPQKPSSHYTRIIFYVGAGQLQGVVLRVLMVDATGNRNRFDFKNLKFNRNVLAQKFQFRPSPNVRRVKLSST